MTELDTHETSTEKPLVIDIHTHFIPKSLPEFSTRYGYSGFAHLDVREAENTGFGKLMRGNSEICKVPRCAWDLNERLVHMNENDVRIQVLSPLPVYFSYWAKADDTADLCRIINNSISKEIQRFKTSDNDIGRFVGLGVVPMQAPELAVVELERCVKELGFVGVVIGTHVNEWNLNATELAPFWESCEELNCPVFIHSSISKSEISRKDRNLWLPELIGMPHETNRAITTVLLGGILEQYPKLKLCFSDGGGSFPYIQGRITQGYYLNSKKCGGESELPPEKFLKKIYCDSNVNSSKSLELLVHVVSDEKVLYGTNYPFIPGSMPIVEEDTSQQKIQEDKNIVKDSDSLEESQKLNILGLNALNFLGIDPSRVNFKK